MPYRQACGLELSVWGLAALVPGLQLDSDFPLAALGGLWSTPGCWLQQSSWSWLVWCCRLCRCPHMVCQSMQLDARDKACGQSFLQHGLVLSATRHADAAFLHAGTASLHAVRPVTCL